MRRTAGAAALGVLSGVLMVAAMAPIGLWPLAFAGLVPMVYAQYRLVPLRWCWIPVALTAAIYSFGAYSRVAIAHALWWSLLVPVGVAVVASLLAVVDRTLSQQWAFRGFLLQMPIFWTGLDAFRQNFSLVGTQGYLPYALTTQTRLIEPVSVFGIFGLELLILVVNYGLALMVLRVTRRQSATPSKAVLAWSASAAVIALAAWSVTGVMLYTSVKKASGPTLRVAAVQPGNIAGSLGTVPTPQQWEQVEARLSEMTRQAAAQGAKLVVWPEEIVPYDLVTAAPQQNRWLVDLVKDADVYLVTGFFAPLPGHTYSNRAALIDPTGAIVGTYTKTHQAPFDNDTFDVGTVFPSHPTAIANIGMAICFDYDFQYTTRYETLSGANLLAVPALQFGRLGSMRESYKLVFDAVESRVPAVSADIAWTSIIVNPTGDIVSAVYDSSATGTPTVLVGDVQLGPRDAPYLKLGNWVGAMAMFGSAVLLAYGTYLVIRRPKRAVD